MKNPSKPRLFWNPNEQCQCYGYPTVCEPNTCFPIRHVFSPTVSCKSFLKCVDDEDGIHETTFYMDGTPCGKNGIRNKVCWNFKCLSIESDNA